MTSASSFGRLFTETNLTCTTAAPATSCASSVKGSNFQVSRDVAPDPAQTSLIDTYKTLVAPIAGKVVGQITTDVTRTPNEAGETPLGDLIADAQLADDSVVTGGQTPQIAFMNPGGIRADLPFDPDGDPGTPGDITYGEAFSVQPFNNYLVSMTLTGQQIYDLLKQQVSGSNEAAPKVLQVSEGFGYRLGTGTSGPVEGSVELNGTPIDKAADLPDRHQQLPLRRW